MHASEELTHELYLVSLEALSCLSFLGDKIRKFIKKLEGKIRFYPHGKPFLIVMRCRDDDGLRSCLLRISVGRTAPIFEFESI